MQETKPSCLNLTKSRAGAGRVFFGTAIAVIGCLTIYKKDFHPYLLPPNHSWLPAIALLAYAGGSLLILAGACIVFKIKAAPVSLLTGSVLLLIVCLYYIPYELIATSAYMHLGEWENAEKELALAGGAFVIAARFPEKNNHYDSGFFGKLISSGTILFSLMMIGFGMLHFVYAKEVVDYVPSWIPWHLAWIYIAGAGLIGAGSGIILNIKRRLAATLLGTMILIWFIALHMPRVIVSAPADRAEEIMGAMLALAYSGIAFVIGGAE